MRRSDRYGGRCRHRRRGMASPHASDRNRRSRCRGQRSGRPRSFCRQLGPTPRAEGGIRGGAATPSDAWPTRRESGVAPIPSTARSAEPVVCRGGQHGTKPQLRGNERTRQLISSLQTRVAVRKSIKYIPRVGRVMLRCMTPSRWTTCSAAHPRARSVRGSEFRTGALNRPRRHGGV